MKTQIWTVIILAVCYVGTASNTRPHIIFIIADDLGWNDVGFHGSNQIPTPNIDALAFTGVILNNYYVNPLCSPSRSALMTGKYPIHTGMQHSVLYEAEPRGLSLKEKLLPEYLRDLGYSNHIVGKWHLGHYKKEYSPLYRGFKSHIGYWGGRHDYFDHTSFEFGQWGLDMRRGMNPAWDLHGQYSTDIFTKEAVNVINSHNTTSPLFLYIAHAAVHSGNPYNPLPIQDDYVNKFASIKNYYRRRFAGMLSKLDDSVGEVVHALASRNMLENSIIVFTTDNGGPAGGFNSNHASNWPLKGVKNTLWEGGVRGAALIWGKHLKQQQRVANQTMHITDWLPTLYSAAGGNSSTLRKGLDAIDLWEAISEDEPSKRVEILHNIDDIEGSASVTVGEWKLHKGTNYKGQFDNWYGPSGRTGSYNTTFVMDCRAGRAVSKIFKLNPEIMNKMREEADVICNSTADPIPCDPIRRPCLFNIAEDPCERRNLADLDKYKDKLREMLNVLQKYNATAVTPKNMPIDEKANPVFWDHVWTNFGDMPFTSRAQS